MVAPHVLMAVPVDTRRTKGTTADQLHETNALLQQSTPKQAAATEVARGLLVQTIHGPCRRVFLLQVGHPRHRKLHARCQLVAADPRTHGIFQTMPFEVARVERGQQGSRSSICLGGESFRRQQVGNRDAGACIKGHSLMGGGKKAIGPIDRAARGISPGIRQHHIGRQILSLRTQPIGNPRTHDRKPIELKAGVLLEGGRGMIG